MTKNWPTATSKIETLHDRSGLAPGRAEAKRMKQTSRPVIEEARKKGARRTAMVVGAIAFAIFLLSLLQGLRYS
ncbi:hypothetical protein [Dyella sedimenti]|uniref:hypothetical protein n=1 Tax=Dyella sedimenti TaxID=2919947 RepID=UPI001FAAC084|nr:hypothetical protein [Dyella sedimenti]